MSLLPQLPNHCHVHQCGNVWVAPGATIAEGVWLQADPGSELRVAAGVCIAAGVIIHAYQGVLKIEAGATLGTGVLVIGSGTIGANSCIGAATTLLNPSVEPCQVIASGMAVTGEAVTGEVTIEPSAEFANESLVEDGLTVESATSPPSPNGGTPAVDSAPKPVQAVVYGRATFEQLFGSLFPGREPPPKIIP